MSSVSSRPSFLYLHFRFLFTARLNVFIFCWIRCSGIKAHPDILLCFIWIYRHLHIIHTTTTFLSHTHTLKAKYILFQAPLHVVQNTLILHIISDGVVIIYDSCKEPVFSETVMWAPCFIVVPINLLWLDAPGGTEKCKESSFWSFCWEPTCVWEQMQRLQLPSLIAACSGLSSWHRTECLFLNLSVSFFPSGR